MKLGTCYFPEHWPEEIWAQDARRMAAIGLSMVRIGEFAWSAIEPEPGRFNWGWLDRAIEVLHGAGLQVILCTPTATPPKWLVDQMPDMIAINADGQPRTFGSRRHYCFSHEGYREEAKRITTALAERYGEHPALAAWQTDNEYGCHATVVSYSDAAAAAFRSWLAERYSDIDALNRAWGNVFWSMTYRSFDEIDPPHLTVTEANPAHRLDYQRFASDEVVSFNRAQCDIIRRASPGRDVTHNFMGLFTDFDHHDVGADLDLATWDSYPLGFTEQFAFAEEDKRDFMCQGHPDVAAINHDIYRGCSGGRWGVMEQQPGPVNWADYNPAPLPGMVRLWTLEAMAHGAELVSYFRWRQAPFAQEQMHAGLLRPDSSNAEGAAEARAAADVIAQIGPQECAKAQVAMVFSYEAEWVTAIQPQGQSFTYSTLVFQWYKALRAAGLDIDMVSPEAPLDDYAAVLVPSMPVARPDFVARLKALSAPVLIGPRTGSKTENITIPEGLAPGNLRDLLPLTITRVESLRPGAQHEGDGWSISRWREDVESELAPEFALKDGRGVVYRHGHARYCSAWPDAALFGEMLRRVADEAGLELLDLPRGLRIRRSATHIFAFNYNAHSVDVGYLGFGEPIVGTQDMLPAGVTIWRKD